MLVAEADTPEELRQEFLRLLLRYRGLYEINVNEAATQRDKARGQFALTAVKNIIADTERLVITPKQVHKTRRPV